MRSAPGCQRGAWFGNVVLVGDNSLALCRSPMRWPRGLVETDRHYRSDRTLSVVCRLANAGVVESGSPIDGRLKRPGAHDS